MLMVVNYQGQSTKKKKNKVLDTRIKNWLANNEKTIVYFPYASLAGDAAKGVKGFAGITVDKRIGTYTGRNIDALLVAEFNEQRRRVFKNFREGKTTIMLATKAFGMGVDVNDVQNVYHYAVSGNLCDVCNRKLVVQQEKLQWKALQLQTYFTTI